MFIEIVWNVSTRETGNCNFFGKFLPDDLSHIFIAPCNHCSYQPKKKKTETSTVAVQVFNGWGGYKSQYGITDVIWSQFCKDYQTKAEHGLVLWLWILFNQKF